MALGGGTAGKGEYLLAAALAIVIIVPLSWTVYKFFGGGGPGSVKVDEYHFKCLKCGNEFTMAAKEVPSTVFMSPGPSTDCPKCQAKRSVALMTQCPNPKCEKWYVPPSAIDPMGMRGLKNICPYCKTDIDQWRGESLKEPEKK